MALSRFVLAADVTVACPTAAQLVTQPAVPASTVAQFNAAGFPVAVSVTGGTVTVIAVNGTATGQTSGRVIVPIAGTITLTYSAAPTWVWAPYGAMPAGYQTRFLKGNGDLRGLGGRLLRSCPALCRDRGWQPPGLRAGLR